MENLRSNDGPQAREATLEVVRQYHLSWKRRDLDAIMALYHPEIEYNDFFQNRQLRLAELREYVRASMPHAPNEALEHSDRIRCDGDTAFIQYQLTLRGSAGLASFRSSEAITVRDGLIWRVNEYSSLINARTTTAEIAGSRSASSRLGLSARQLSVMAQDLQSYFQSRQAYLDPELSLQQVAESTGYSRNQISYLLNQVLGQTFYRYVNHARLNHLLDQLETLLAHNNPAAIRMDQLAFAAGFNSLSAFYKSFSAHLATTPKAYLKFTHEQQKAARNQ